jgi:hypothetical protein
MVAELPVFASAVQKRGGRVNQNQSCRRKTVANWKAVQSIETYQKHWGFTIL